MIQYYNISITDVRFKEDFVMKKLPQISEAEYEVMKVVWNNAPISTNEVTERLVKTTDWSPKTIQTLLKRLVQKGALTYEKNSRVFVYTPLVKKDEYLDQENSSFLKRFYDGNLTSMLTNYLEKDTLSEKEIKTLQDLLQARTRKGER
jgi:BlaI family penicillinase repressor